MDIDVEPNLKYFTIILAKNKAHKTWLVQLPRRRRFAKVQSGMPTTKVPYEGTLVFCATQKIFPDSFGMNIV